MWLPAGGWSTIGGGSRDVRQKSAGGGATSTLRSPNTEIIDFALLDYQRSRESRTAATNRAIRLGVGRYTARRAAPRLRSAVLRIKATRRLPYQAM